VSELRAEITAYYRDRRPERTRITEGLGALELERTREILRRHLPPPPARLLDVGGGEGVHARWLAADGYDVDLVDPVDAHVEQARVDAAASPRSFSAELGDARKLAADDASYDAVLVLGPLYHLTDRAERVQALSEARRVVRAGGLVFVAAISRFASLFDGLARGELFDPEFRAVVERDLADGQHRNPTKRLHWFTTAFFHHPDELREEAAGAGLAVREIVGVEGMAAWITPLASRWDDDADREVIVDAARVIEREPTLAGLSPHLLLVAEHS
jgi:2-polyprenyl-3-methyl-5-hydroxy-6-metoxy-1,4-benzoquinol methylase